jgi:nucleoside-diphosphate-sugar epimerase
VDGKILITGASGMVGGAVARRLASNGFDLRAASRDPTRLAGTPGEAAQMPSPGSGPEAWLPLLEGVSHVVHCAGIAHAGPGIAESVYFEANTRLTEELAVAAAGNIGGKLVFLSSIRALVGPVSAGTVTEATEPAPEDAYGRSKLKAEEEVRSAFAATRRYTILRPVLVYGPGAKGSLAALIRLARLPLPLPSAGLDAKRSLLCLEACAAAIEHTLFSRDTNGGSYVVADRAPLSTAEMLRALRRGLDRPPLLFPVPKGLLSVLFSAAGKSSAWRRLSHPLVADPSTLAKTGWHPVEDTAERLENLARELR